MLCIPILRSTTLLNCSSRLQSYWEIKKAKPFCGRQTSLPLSVGNKTWSQFLNNICIKGPQEGKNMEIRMNRSHKNHWHGFQLSPSKASWALNAKQRWLSPLEALRLHGCPNHRTFRIPLLSSTWWERSEHLPLKKNNFFNLTGNVFMPNL